MSLVFTPHDAFVMLKDIMNSPDHRIYWAEGLHVHDDQDYAVVFNVLRGFPEYVVCVEFMQPAYDAFWRLVFWNNRRLDSMSAKEN